MKGRLPPLPGRAVPTDAIRFAPPAQQVADPVLEPTVRQVEAQIRAIPHGETRTIKELRLDLAETHGAATACPVVTGQRLREIAGTVSEQLVAGFHMEHLVPVWRVLDESSPLLHRTGSALRPLALRRRAEAPASTGGRPAVLIQSNES